MHLFFYLLFLCEGIVLTHTWFPHDDRPGRVLRANSSIFENSGYIFSKSWLPLFNINVGEDEEGESVEYTEVA
jgi:hypothetical protein